MKILIKKTGSNQHTGEFTSKEIADFLSRNDSGRDDNGYFQEKVEAHKDFIQENITAEFHSGTFLGFTCDFDKVFDAIDPM